MRPSAARMLDEAAQRPVTAGRSISDRLRPQAHDRLRRLPVDRSRRCVVEIVAEVGRQDEERVAPAPECGHEIGRSRRRHLSDHDRQHRELVPQHPLEERQLHLERVLGRVGQVVGDRARVERSDPKVRSPPGRRRAASPTRPPPGRPPSATARNAAARRARRGGSPPHAPPPPCTRRRRPGPSRRTRRAARRSRAGHCCSCRSPSRAGRRRCPRARPARPGRRARRPPAGGSGPLIARCAPVGAAVPSGRAVPRRPLRTRCRSAGSNRRDRFATPRSRSRP